MGKIKEVSSSEVHWKVAGWNIKEQANARIKQSMGPDAVYFAPVFVTHNSYYWSEPDIEGWHSLSVATEQDVNEAREIIAGIRSRALKRAPSKASILEQVLSCPNDDFIFVRRRSGDHLELRIAGWGFANYKRAGGGRIVDPVVDEKINEITISFSIDGQVVPNRLFSFQQGMNWASTQTDDKGYFSFGQQTPGSQISVRDTATGIESVTVVDASTTNIDVDVTEFVNVSVVARHDGAPISGENVEIAYGRRNQTLVLANGTAYARLPWFEGVEAVVRFRNSEQCRELRKDANNEFVFESETPKQPKTNVEVHVTSNDQNVPGESVVLMTPYGPMNLVTGYDGIASIEMDFNGAEPIMATVRDQNESKIMEEGLVRFEFAFQEKIPVPFDCYLLAVNSEDKPMAMYPIRINVGDGSQTMDCLTDNNGLIGPIHVVSGNTMTAWDGNQPNVSEQFLLDETQQKYIFKLPYVSTNGGDIRLRVTLRNNRPAVGLTCILKQDEKRVTSTLDANGDMWFNHTDFDNKKPVMVDLYYPNREYPTIPLELIEGETEYELVEVDGPQPWWKIAGEIVLAVGGLIALVPCYEYLRVFLASLPYYFS